MKIYCRQKEMKFQSGSVGEVFISNYQAEVEDEIGSRLILERPNMFRAKAFPAGDRIDTSYSAEAPPATVADAPEDTEAN
jgi:hypothetical protein